MGAGALFGSWEEVTRFLQSGGADDRGDLDEPDNGTPAPSPFAAPRSEHAPRAPTPAPQAGWLAGDLHMHVSPPDHDSDVRLSVAEIASRSVAPCDQQPGRPGQETL